MLYAGASKKLITPEKPATLVGVPRDYLVNKVYSDLWARGLVLSMGKTSAAIVVLDLVGIDLPFVRKVRRNVQERTGIRNVLISATHNHSGPAIREGIYNDSCSYGPIDKAWKEMVEEKIVEVITEASNGKKQVTIGIGKAKIKGVAASRRWKLANGEIWWADKLCMGEKPAAAVISKGIADEEMGMLCFKGKNGRMVAVLLNYACHPWIWFEELISAEIPGEVVKIVEKNYPEAVCIFSNGCGGDVTAGANLGVIPKGKEAALRWWKEQHKRMGRLITRPMGPALTTIRYIQPTNMTVTTRKVKLILQDRYLHPQNHHECHINKSIKLLAERKEKQVEGNKLTTEVQVIRIDNINIVAFPSEMFVKFGLKIKREFPNTLVIGYANDFTSYIPTSKAYDEGYYEVGAALAVKGSGEILLKEALACLRA